MWIQPMVKGSRVRWGHADGLQLGLDPEDGPRGLLRLYAPYVSPALLNFVAIEPIPVGQTERGFSELEASTLDPGQPGKRFWTSDDPSDPTPRATTDPVPGVITREGDLERLTFYVHCERFDNGAEPVVRVQFRADRPNEVSLATYVRPGSAPLATCILTATMGNYARLRRLYVGERTVTPADLWPGWAGPADRTAGRFGAGFTEHGRFPVSELRRDGTAAIVSAAPDEPDPSAATYAEGTAEHWKYQGVPAVQTWRVPHPSDHMEARVNARFTYWASESAIPGGPAYENFEIVDRFTPGQEFVYGVEPV